jgi:Fe2+ or Zn2+ uptake regulation protein
MTLKTSQAESLVHELVEVRLRQGQLRYTPGRRTIVEVLYRGSRPMSISEIERESPKLPRSSAYRHLVDLQGVGAVRNITATGDFTLFELSEDLTEHHHHLLCVRCGAIQDVTPTEAFEREIATTVKQYARRTGFSPLSHSLDVIGHCARCSS